MANVLSEEKKQQVIALGRLGWTLRRIQQATRMLRETASAYLKVAGIAIRPPGGWGRRAVPKPAKEVITDFGVGKPASAVSPDPAPQPPTLPLPGTLPRQNRPTRRSPTLARSPRRCLPCLPPAVPPPVPVNRIAS